MAYWWFWLVPAAMVVLFVGLAALIQWDKRRTTKKSGRSE